MARVESYETSPNWNPSSQENLAKAARKTFEKAVEERDRSDTANKLAEHFETYFESEDGEDTKLTTTEDLHNAVNTASEDLKFGNNSALYTTAIADFIEREFEPTLLEAGVIKRIQLPEQGKDSIKIPKQPDLQNASTVADDGTLTDDSTDYGQLTINTDFIGLVSTMTVELLRNANVDLMEDQLRQITNAIERKVDSDIIAEIEDASAKDGTYGDNSNYSYQGSGNFAGYDAVVNAFYDAHANNANPDMFVASPEFYKNLFTDADMKDAVAFGTVSQSGDNANVVPQVQSILGFPALMADQMSANRGHWIDSERLGYLVEKTGVETMDQQLDGKAAFEVKAVKGYGVGVTKPQAVFGIINDTAEPA